MQSAEELRDKNNNFSK